MLRRPRLRGARASNVHLGSRIYPFNKTSRREARLCQQGERGVVEPRQNPAPFRRGDKGQDFGTMGGKKKPRLRRRGRSLRLRPQTRRRTGAVTESLSVPKP